MPEKAGLVFDSSFPMSNKKPYQNSVAKCGENLETNSTSPGIHLRRSCHKYCHLVLFPSSTKLF